MALLGEAIMVALGSSSLKKTLWIVLGAVALGLAVFLLVTDPAALGGWLALGLGIAVVLGMAVKMVRAPRGNKLRAGMAPIGAAAETYQELLLGREPTGSAIEHSFPAVPDDKASSGS